MRREVSEWIVARGPQRKQALDAACDSLLSGYLTRWPKTTPVQLYWLASTRQCSILSTPGLRATARLVPHTGGFTIMVGPDLAASRFRNAVAHEIAHTLFYELSPDRAAPTRIAPVTPSEEHFCVDLARRILAPSALLAQIGAHEACTLQDLYGLIRRNLLMSRANTARILLDDYAMALGVAGWWINTDGLWVLKPQGAAKTAFASPGLTRQQRKDLQALAKLTLEGASSSVALPYEAVVDLMPERGLAFVLVARLLKGKPSGR